MDCYICFEVDVGLGMLWFLLGVLYVQVENVLIYVGVVVCVQYLFCLCVQCDGQCWMLDLCSVCGLVLYCGYGIGMCYIEVSFVVVCLGGWCFVQGVEGDEWYGWMELICVF